MMLQPPPLTPRPSTRQGQPEPEPEPTTSSQAEAAGPQDNGEEESNYFAGMERLELATTMRMAGAKAEGRGKVRKLEPDPDTNHVMESSEEGPPRVVVKDTVAVRTAFLKYCNSKMRPPEMQRMLEHGMAGPCLTAPKLMAMCNELGLWQPKGPLSFIVVGAIFSALKNDEVQGLLYPDFLEALMQLALESGCNVAAQLQDMHAEVAKAQEKPARAPSHRKLDPHLMHSVEDLVAGLPPVATQRAKSYSTPHQRPGDPAAAGQLPPLPGPPERFSRIFPLLHSPSLGRLFTHSQIRELGQALGGAKSRRSSASEHSAASGPGPGLPPDAESPAHGADSPTARSARGGSGDGAADAPRSVAPPRPGLSRISPHRKPPLLPTISARNALRSSVPTTPSILAAAGGAAADTDSGQSTPSHPLHHAALSMWSSLERRSDPGHHGWKSGAPSLSTTRPNSKRSSYEATNPPPPPETPVV